MSDVAATGSILVTLFVSIASSSGIWGTLQYVLSRRERKDKQRKEKRDEDKAEKDRSDLLAEAQRMAQQTALDSADTRYKNLESDYGACRRGLGEVREAAACLIDVVESMMMKMVVTDESYSLTLEFREVVEVRKSITDARRHLLFFTDWKVPLKYEEPPK